MTLVLGAPAWASMCPDSHGPSPLLHLVRGPGEEVGFLEGEADRAHPHGTWTPHLAARPPSLHVDTSFEVAALLNLSPLKGSLRTAPGTTPSCLCGAPFLTLYLALQGRGQRVALR